MKPVNVLLILIALFNFTFISAKKIYFNKQDTYIVCTLGIPGSGKSTTYNALLELTKLNSEVLVVKESSDEFKIEYSTLQAQKEGLTVIDIMKRKRENIDLGNHVLNLFYKRCQETLNDLKSHKDKYKFFYIDINVRAVGLRSYLEHILNDKDFKVILFIPKITNYLENLPFSLDYVVQSYNRAIMRKPGENPTLIGDLAFNPLVLFKILSENKISHMEEIEEGVDFLFSIDITDETHYHDESAESFEVNEIIQKLIRISQSSPKLFNQYYDNVKDDLYYYMEKRYNQVSFDNTKEIVMNQVMHHISQKLK